MAAQQIQLPTPYGRDNYETWYQIELSIAKFDRLFNKVEKFSARKLSDPFNHERREKRMNERSKQRWVDNYAYFLGDLTEEEQKYRDYFETDLEVDPEDEFVEEQRDRVRLAEMGHLDPKLYDFVETSMYSEPHENFEDLIEDKIFKYKYRQNADPPHIFETRMGRVISRFMERAKTRDPAIEQDLAELYHKDAKDSSLASFMVDYDNFGATALKGTQAWREYVAKEGVQQWRDYYEDAEEEQPFFEYLDNLTNRDQIRFMEVFEDWTQQGSQAKGYVLIPKREFNPELSAFSNLLLDLVDFRDRVRPMAHDIARHDTAR